MRAPPGHENEAVATELLSRRGSGGELRVTAAVSAAPFVLQALGSTDDTGFDVTLRLTRTPVREALRELEALGIVTSKAYQGVRVREFTVDDVLETYPVRIALETLALREAAPRISDQAIDHLQSLLDGMRAALADDDRRREGALNADFHRAIVEAAENGALLRSWSVLEHLARVYLRPLYPAEDDLRRDVERHQPIIDALRQRDGEAAVAALEEHLRAVIDTVTRAKASEMAAATR
jgi:DNA-binding GntR family transcriptional regulator